MKGILASRYPSDEGKYSDLMVLRSAAGWYVGTVFTHHGGFQEPGSRESEYFATRQEAQDALDNQTWNQRSKP